jgi:hypothetical protein
MNRGYFALAGGLVLAAVIALYIAVSRPSADDTAVRDPAGPKIAEADPGTSGSRLRPIAPSDPALPAGSDAPAGSGSAARDYMIGGVRVRDHRSGEHAQLDIPPAIHPPNGRRIPSQLTYAITQRLRGVVNECAASVPREARGTKAGLAGEIMIDIKNQQATVTSAVFQLRDVTAPPASVKQCLEQKSVGVAVPAGDEPDVENYAITLSLRLP